MHRRGRVRAVLAAIFPSIAAAQAPSRVLFRVFLSDGRVLSSYGEWARLDDRVIFSMPTQLSRDPVELHLVTIPAKRVDWPRTERYAESVRAAAYAATRGDADFAAFSSEVARVLNDVARIEDPASRLRTAERARQKLADWPAAHYGYRIGEVRSALGVLDEVIAQLRVAVGITRFDLSLSANAPLAEPPPPPLPPPTDAELVEQFVAAASVAESPVERIGLLKTVMRLIDRAMAMMPGEWASRMRRVVTGELDREQRAEQAYNDLRTRTLEEANKLAARGRAADLEKLRDKVREEDRRLGGQRPGDIAALLDTIDLEATAAIAAREARQVYEKRSPVYRKYRRSTNGAFKVFTDAAIALEQVRSMTGPAVSAIGPLTKRLASTSPRLSESACAGGACFRSRDHRQRVGAGAECVPSARRSRVGQQHRHRTARIFRGGRGPDAVSARAHRSAHRDGAAGRQVITPRRIRLLGSPDLAGYRSTLVDLTRALDASTADDTFVVAPTTAAAEQLRRTLDARLRDHAHRPHIGPRSALYDELISRLPEPLRLLIGIRARSGTRGRRARSGGVRLAAAVSRPSGARRGDARAVRSPAQAWPHR